MRKHNFIKTCLFSTAVISLFSFSAFAGTRDGLVKGAWGDNANGRYWMDDNTTSVLKDTWAWIDTDDDGTAEQYYFGTDGYLLTNSVIAGYQVNENGQLVENGIVQTNLMANALETEDLQADASQTDATQADASQAEGGKVLGVSRTASGEVTTKGEAGTFLEKINTYRSANGLKPYTMDSKLCTFADKRAAELNTNFSQNTADGGDPWDELDKIYGSKIKSCSDAMVQAESIDDAFKAFSGSAMGKKVFSSSKYTSCGIGIKNGYYYIVGAKV